MASQREQVARCRAITDFNKDWNLLKIGTQYFHSFSQLQEEFGPISDTQIIKYLCSYYTAEAPVEKNEIMDKKAKKGLTEFFNNRIKDIQTSNDFKNNSFYKSQDHTLVIELKNEVKNLTDVEGAEEATDPTKQEISKDDLLKKFFKGLYLVAFTKEDPLEVSKEFDKMMEDLDKLPLDEKFVRTKELMTELLEKASTDGKDTANSLRKYIEGEKPTNSPKVNMSISKDNKTKVDIIKLISLFQTGNALSGLNMKNKVNLDNYFESISTQLPHMVEDILLTYRSFTRFYRARYTNVMKQFDTLMKNFKFENYPIELMIQLVFIMYNMARYVNKDEFSELYSIFKNNEGLLRFTLKSPSKEYKTIIGLIGAYRNHFRTIKDTSVDLENKEDYAYQLIHMHKRQKAREFTKPILQLISGKDITINTDKLNARIGQLVTEMTEKEALVKDEKDRRKAVLTGLRDAIDTFFKDKEETLYIIYQEAPEKLLQPEGDQIKQLGQLQCIMGNITDELVATKTEPSESEATIPRSIEYVGDTRLDKITNIKNQREKEILYNLTTRNTFADFGITIKEPLQLTQSLTQITATLLNAQYLNHKLKDINKKLKDD